MSHFVRPNTALDREALERATSVYLPDRVLPMLPELISNGLASLQPGKVRYTKSAVMEFTADGLRVSTELHSAAIRSSKRLTYEQVDEFLADREAARRKLGGKVCDLLGRHARAGHDAPQAPADQRRARTDHARGQGGTRQARPRDRGPRGRKHREPPDDRGVHAGRQRGRGRNAPRPRAALPAPHPPGAQPAENPSAPRVHDRIGLQDRRLQSRFELQKLLAAAVGRPEQHAVHFAVLRSLQRAIYSPKDEGHYALASECYCHFTSPIRRYPDLTVHRLVDAILGKSKPRNDYDELVTLGRHCSDREQRAEAAERDLTKLKLLAYLSDRIGEEMDAVVTGVESYGIFVQGIELPAEGLVRVETLSDDYYRFDRAAHTLAGHRAGNSYRLGDLLRVAVARVDLERRELDFRVVERKKSQAAEIHEEHEGHEEGRETEKSGKTKETRRTAIVILWQEAVGCLYLGTVGTPIKDSRPL